VEYPRGIGYDREIRRNRRIPKTLAPIKKKIIQRQLRRDRTKKEKEDGQHLKRGNWEKAGPGEVHWLGMGCLGPPMTRSQSTGKKVYQSCHEGRKPLIKDNLTIAGLDKHGGTIGVPVAPLDRQTLRPSSRVRSLSARVLGHRRGR